MNLLYPILFLLFGFIIGRLSNMVRVIGTLRVDNSDPEDGSYLFLELETGTAKLEHGDIVSFKVNTESYISHE